MLDVYTLAACTWCISVFDRVKRCESKHPLFHLLASELKQTHALTCLPTYVNYTQGTILDSCS